MVKRDSRFFETIGIANDYMFRSVFGDDADLAGDLLSTVLEREVGEVEFVSDDAELRSDADARGTYFDIYLRTSTGEVGNVEMQDYRETCLSLRVRAHLSAMDRDAWRKGEHFRDLRTSTTVFVCTYDPLGDELTRYTVRRRVEETGKRFEDNQEAILLVASERPQGVGEGLSRFLRYVAGYHDDDVMSDKFVRAVDAVVRRNRASAKWREGFVTLEEKLYIAREEGREEGRLEGREEGRLSMLVGLVSDGILSAEVAAARLGMTEEEFLAQAALGR